MSTPQHIDERAQTRERGWRSQDRVERLRRFATPLYASLPPVAAQTTHEVTTNKAPAAPIIAAPAGHLSKP